MLEKYWFLKWSHIINCFESSSNFLSGDFHLFHLARKNVAWQYDDWCPCNKNIWHPWCLLFPKYYNAIHQQKRYELYDKRFMCNGCILMNGLVFHRWSTRQSFKGSVWETATSDRRSIDYTLKYLVKFFFSLFSKWSTSGISICIYHFSAHFPNDILYFCTRAYFQFWFFTSFNRRPFTCLFVCLFHEVSVVVFIVFFCLASSIL